jgi:hypothetical protein
MNAIHEIEESRDADAIHCNPRPRVRWRRLLLASTAALSMGVQDVAWATCSDGTTFPQNGYVLGSSNIPPGANPNWSGGTFTGTVGSLFVPDNSTNEFNDPTQPLTGGGHNWVFDQGSTLCKETDIGGAGAVSTSWSIPPNTPTKCVVLPIIKGGRVTNLGDIPGQGDVITPTCDPTKLSTTGPNPANTSFNQLGCAISRGAPTTSQTATSWLFVAGIKGGLFSVRLDNVIGPVKGGDAGKTSGIIDYYSAIPEGQKLTNASVSPDGQFAIATSNKRAQPIYACLNPLGDAGLPSQPINPNFFVPPAGTVQCMSVGNNNLQTDLVTEFGPDLQPYFGGQRVVNSFDAQPGGTSRAAWPNCIWQNNGSISIADAFNFKRANGCGNAASNFGFTSALVTQPSGLIRHTAKNGDLYMYSGPVGGTMVQFKLRVDPISGLTSYNFRTYVTGLSLNTGLGVADDLQSVMIYTDPSAIGLSGQEVIVKLPICEDM